MQNSQCDFEWGLSSSSGRLAELAAVTLPIATTSNCGSTYHHDMLVHGPHGLSSMNEKSHFINFNISQPNNFEEVTPSNLLRFAKAS